MASFVGPAWGASPEGQTASTAPSNPFTTVTAASPLSFNPFTTTSAQTNGDTMFNSTFSGSAATSTEPAGTTALKNPFSSSPASSASFTNPFQSTERPPQSLPAANPFSSPSASQATNNAQPMNPPRFGQISRSPSPLTVVSAQDRPALPVTNTLSGPSQPLTAFTGNGQKSLPSGASSSMTAFETASDGEDVQFGQDGAGDGKWAKRKRKPQSQIVTVTDGTKNGSFLNASRRNNKGTESGRTGMATVGTADKEAKKPWQDTKTDRTSQGRLHSAPLNGVQSQLERAQTAKNPDLMDPSNPYAAKIISQLKTDGISPPQWPTDPFSNVSNMGQFRERYKEYRERARGSLIAAGLIDDPEDRKRLEDAINFKGISEAMCPAFEQITRITEFDVKQVERSTGLMVKKLARSAAGQEAPLPMDVRSIACLRRTLDYLINDLLQSDDNLPMMHGFLWDRTRAIRRDFAFFSSMTPDELRDQVYCLETITRFHVTSLHLLSQSGFAPDGFSEQQEIEQLGKSLISLMYAYNDCNAQGVVCENEAEFRAYQLIFRASHPDILETVQTEWDPQFWNDSDEVRTAVSLVEALQNTQDFHGPLKGAPSFAASSAYNSYFRIVEDAGVSFTMACFAEIHFSSIRRSILTALNKAYARPRASPKDITAAVLNAYMRFDTIDELIEFVELHGLELALDAEDPDDASRRTVVLRFGQALPYPRLKHAFSRKIVEKKRNAHSLPAVIHQTVFEDLSAATQENAMDEDSLFVSSPAPNVGGRRVHFEDDLPGDGHPSVDGVGAANGKGMTIPGTAKVSPLASSFNRNVGFAASSLDTAPKPSPPAGPVPELASISKASPFNTSAVQGERSFLPASSAPAPFKPLGAETIPTLSPAHTSGGEQKRPSTPHSPFAFLKAPGIGTNLGQSITTHGAVPGINAKPGLGLVSPSPTPDPSTTNNLAPTAPSFKITPPTPQFASSSLPDKSEQSDRGTKEGSGKPDLQAGLGDLSPPKQDSAKPRTTAAVPPSARGSSRLLADTQLSSDSSKIAAKGVLAGADIGEASMKKSRGEFVAGVTNWFVLGDNGILDQFVSYVVEDLVKDAYETFQRVEQQRRRREEEKKAREEAHRFRVYNLRVKFFYRWRDIARGRRLGSLRRSGRDQLRAYQEARRAEKLAAKMKSAKLQQQVAERIAALDNVREFKKMLGKRRRNPQEAEDALFASGIFSGINNERHAIAELVRREDLGTLNNRTSSTQDAEEALLASGVLSGVTEEQDAIARIVRGSQTPPRTPSAQTKPNLLTKLKSGLSASVSKMKPTGAKTQALREQFSSGNFRRSLPSISSHSRFSPSPARDISPTSAHVSKVSDRWRLKAMGLVTMPNGSALPEYLAFPMKYEGKRYPGLGSFGLPPTRSSSRRASTADEIDAVHDVDHDDDAPSRSPASGPILSDVNGNEPSEMLHKRKRSVEETFESGEQSPSNSSKRILLDTQKMIRDMQGMRREMEEGRGWFRQQNERMQSEISSRGGTPWSQDL